VGMHIDGDVHVKCGWKVQRGNGEILRGDSEARKDKDEM